LDLSSFNTGCSGNQEEAGLIPENDINQEGIDEVSTGGYSGRNPIKVNDSEHPELNAHNYPKSWDEI